MKRKLKPGKKTQPSRTLIAMLAADTPVDITVTLNIRIGNPPLDQLQDNAEGLAKGIAILRHLWPIYAEPAVEYCIRRAGPGIRPTLWWDGKSRPYIKPRDWCLDGDRERYEAARRESDLKFLREHHHLTKEEERELAKPKEAFGPEDGDEDL